MNFTDEILRKLRSLGEGTAMVKLSPIKNTVSFRRKRKVATLCFNSPDFVALVLAAVQVGVEIYPLNPSYKKYEIEKYTEGIDVVINDDTLRNMLLTTSEEKYEMSRNGGVIFFSSGTTGPPKPFFYSQKLLLNQLNQFQMIAYSDDYHSPSGDDVCYGVLPYFHAGGLITVFSQLWSGAKIVVNERFEPQDFLRNIETERVTILFLVPPVMKFLAEADLTGYDLTSLRSIFIGAASTRLEHFEAVNRRLKLDHLIQLYGITEFGVLLSSTGRGVCDGKNVGKPYPLVAIEVTNDEICIKSAATGDEFLPTGDLGYLDDDGNLIISGRKKEMIKIRGWQVNPSEIEQLILTVPGVQDCAVHLDNDLLVASIVGDIDVKALLKITRDSFASYKQIQQVRKVNAIPRNASGKLQRHLL